MSISFEDFSKLEIRLGTIREAGVVEGADKLLRLLVDVGEPEPRQIISGIRESYPDPEKLIGKQCPFIVNIAPRTIRGHESRGMILAVSTASGGVALLSPDNTLDPGASIH